MPAAALAHGTVLTRERQIAEAAPPSRTTPTRRGGPSLARDPGPAAASLPLGEDLLAEDIRVPAVLGELPQDMEEHPAERHRPSPMAGEHGVEIHPLDRGMRPLHGSPVVS